MEVVLEAGVHSAHVHWYSAPSFSGELVHVNCDISTFTAMKVV